MLELVDIEVCTKLRVCFGNVGVVPSKTVGVGRHA